MEIRIHDWANVVQFNKGFALIEYRTIMAVCLNNKLYIRPNTRLDLEVLNSFNSIDSIVSVEYEEFDSLIEKLGELK